MKMVLEISVKRLFKISGSLHQRERTDFIQTGNFINMMFLDTVLGYYPSLIPQCSSVVTGKCFSSSQASDVEGALTGDVIALDTPA